MTIPTSQTLELNRLAGAGALSGIPPAVLAAIDQAESSGKGGSINTSGYGGYFGLSTTKYPGGYQLSPNTLTQTTPGAFATQAETAAAEFQSLLAKNGGNVYAAEAAYQGGGSEGTNVFHSMGIPSNIAPGNVTSSATADTINQTMFGPNNDAWPANQPPTGDPGQAVPGGVLSLPWSQIPSSVFGDLLKGLVSSGLIVRGTLIVFGLLVVLVGLSQVSKAEQGPVKTAGQATQNVRVRVTRTVSRIGKVAAA